MTYLPNRNKRKKFSTVIVGDFNVPSSAIDKMKTNQ